MAVAPGLLVATAVEGLRRWPRTARRGRAVRRVLLVGEAAGLDRAAALLNSRTDHDYRLVAAIPVGPARPGYEGLQVPGRLASAPADDDVTTVLGGAYAHEADLVLVAPGPQLTGDRLRPSSAGDCTTRASPCPWSPSSPASRPAGSAR